MIDKELISKRFRQSLKTYEQESIVQLEIAQKICSYLPVDDKHYKVLEIGCGSGNLTREILKKIKVKKFYINDLVDEAVNHLNFGILSNNKTIPVYGDIEQIEIPGNLDLVISASTFQWVENINTVFKKIYKALKPGGIFMFSSFGKRNFNEIKTLTGNGLNYLNLCDYEKISSDLFKIIKLDDEIIKIYFPDSLSVIQHLKKTGVNALKKIYWGKNNYLNFINGYEKFKTGEGYPLTYHPIYYIAKK